ncbi:MAG TPA: xanthine phosphoribosyltransferase, partial [Actinobacteria bacterium]|nr:xanthine phosphoribosyltransferase [Actinomycetota bacterium]
MDLQTRIAEEATVKGDIVLVDHFLNHRVDPEVMLEVGKRVKALAEGLEPDVILTAEASGIPPAMAASLATGIPMIYAKKYVTPGERTSYWREVSSTTKGFEYRIEVRDHVLSGGRVLIVDDFLNQGRTALALGEIVEEAGGEVLGVVFVVEKSWVGGRQRIEERGW